MGRIVGGGGWIGPSGTPPNVKWYSGTGSPESAQAASIGSIYSDYTNGKLYVKATGAGTTTGWVVAGTQT